MSIFNLPEYFWIRVFYTLFFIATCHVIGDYVITCDFLHSTKGENWYHLVLHSFLYILPYALLMGMDWKVSVLFITHMIIDAGKARYHKISYLWDQILHYAIAICLYLVPELWFYYTH